MENKNLSIAQSYFQFINNKDFTSKGYFDLFTEDVEIYYPKFGYDRGIEGVQNFGRQVRNLITELHFEMDKFNFIVADKYVIVEGVEKGITSSKLQFPDGIVSHGKFCTVFEFESGRIKRMHCYVDPDFASEDKKRVQLLNRTESEVKKEDLEAQTRGIIEDFYAIQLGEKEGNITDLFGEEVDWDLPGNKEKFSWIGKRKTNKEVGEFFRKLQTNVQSEKFEIDFISVNGTNATVVGQLSSKILQYDKVYHTEFVAIFKVIEGKIVKYHFLEDSYKLDKIGD